MLACFCLRWKIYKYLLMSKKIYLLSILIFVHGSLQAQKYSINGVLFGPDSMPVSNVRVMLFQPSEQKRIPASTNSDGAFIFTNLAPGNYRMGVRAEGLAPHRQQIEIVDQDVQLAPIYLEEASFDMDEVTIQGQVAPAQQKGDTTVYNSGAFKTNPDASADDLLKKMPGVTVEGGQVQAQGENVQQVLVDGKPFFGDDPNAALKNLPAEVVDKIEIFDQQSEQAQLTGFDDGQTVKTVNIVTKVEMRNGTFGNGYAGYGYEDKYQAGGNVNFFNGARRISLLGMSNNINKQNFSTDDLLGVASAGGSRGRGRGGRGGRSGFGGGRGPGGGGNVGEFLVGEQGGISSTHALGMNYSDQWGKKTEVSGSYFFNLSDNITEQITTQQYLINTETGQTYRELSGSDSRNINHRFNLRMTHEIDDKQSIVFRPRIRIQQNSGISSDSSQMFFGNQLLNDASNILNADLTGIDASAQLLYRRRFEKRGRSLMLRLSGDYKQNSGENFLFSDLNYYTEPISLDSLDQSSVLSANGYSAGASIRFTEPAGKKGNLQFSYSFSPQWNDSDKNTFHFQELTGKYSLQDSLLSNVFENTYFVHEAGAGYMLRGKKAFFISRINFQRAVLNNDQTFPFAEQTQNAFNSILPFAMLRINYEKGRSLRLIYRASTNPPSVNQLQRVLDNSNPLQLSTGNSDLKQNYQNFLMVRYNATNTEKNQVVMAFVSGQYTHNYIADHTTIAVADTLVDGIFLPQGAQLTRPVNLSGYYNLRTFLTWGRLVNAIKTNVNLSLTGNYLRSPGLINEQLNIANTASLGLGVVLSSNISEKIDFTVSSRTNLNQVINSLQANANANYLNQQTAARLNLILWKGIVFRSELEHTLYQGLSDGFDQNFWLWNASLGKKLFKNQRGEIQLSVFDMLRQNNSISRTVTETYIEDLQTAVLQRYVMLTFTYQLRQFKSGEMPEAPEGMRPGMRPGGPPPGGRRW